MQSVLAVVGLSWALTMGLSAPVVAAGAASSEVIEVFPGPNAIAEALAIAEPGDILNIHAGTYSESVAVDVRNVTLRSAGDGLVTVDGTCTAAVTVDVSAEGVTIRGLRVVGAGKISAPKAIDLSRVDTGRVVASTVEDTCGYAWYGINVNAGGSIRILNNRTSGFDHAGIYVGEVTSTPFGPLVVRGNETFGNDRGVIVRASSGAAIQVIGNSVHDNLTTGIWLELADGILVERNVVLDNRATGIQLDESSDDNLIRGNMADGHIYDLYDGGGAGNCWLSNRYTTSFGDIQC
jgi:parallel beta-helix repeat protein